MILIETFLTDFICGLLSLCLLFIIYSKWCFRYWKSRNVPYLEPEIPFGNIPNPLRQVEPIGITMKRLYQEMKSRGWRHAGVYTMASPSYFVLDLDYIKNILTKDFHHFVDRGFYYNEKDEPIGAHLLAISGTKWKHLRTKLTPTFTSGKMKMMFPTLIDCEENLLKKIEAVKDAPIDIKDVLGCFTTDIIGSCAFGLDCNTFKDDDSPFRKYGKKVFKVSTWRRMLMAFYMNFPDMARALHVRQVQKDVSDFFTQVVKDTVDYREKNNVARKDFLQLLIDLKNNKPDEDDDKPLTIDEVVAQSFIFFLAGFETSSTTMTFALYELAKNQEVQDKVRKEVNRVLMKYEDKMTYEAIQEMKYLNQVLNETLRKYPPIPFLTRRCVKEYKVPDQDTIIEEGIKVIIPVIGIHYDPEYYPDPETFDPERFSEANSRQRHPYTHLPFGEGPRNCIGLRFGLMQSKVGLTSLLKRYKFTLNEKTKQPLKFQVNSFILTADGDIWLNAEKV